MTEDNTEVEIKHLITHDFVLDVYEQSLNEPDEDKRLAIIESAKILSEQIGSYLTN